MGETRFSVRLPVTFARAVRDKAKHMDATVSQIIRWLLRRWLAGEIEAIPPEGKEGEEGEKED